MDVSKMEPYYPPVARNSLAQLTIGLGGAGLIFMALFLVYEVTATKFSRSFVKEFSLATAASAFLGFGTLFLLLWVGIYV